MPTLNLPVAVTNTTLGSIVEIAQGPPAFVKSNAPYVAAASVDAMSLGDFALPVHSLLTPFLP